MLKSCEAAKGMEHDLNYPEFFHSSHHGVGVFVKEDRNEEQPRSRQAQ